jgi:hypothetical protein
MLIDVLIPNLEEPEMAVENGDIERNSTFCSSSYWRVSKEAKRCHCGTYAAEFYADEVYL